MLDLLLKRYSNIDYVMKMDAEDGLKLIIKAIENDVKDKLYLQWLHDDARYEKSFNEYFESNLPYRKSTEEEKQKILEEYGGDAIDGSF